MLSGKGVDDFFKLLAKSIRRLSMPERIFAELLHPGGVAVSRKIRSGSPKRPIYMFNQLHTKNIIYIN